MINKILLSTSLALSLFALTPQEYMKQQQEEFINYKEKEKNDFKNYKQEQFKAFEAYKEEIAKVWQEPKMSSVKNWLAYSEDKKTRTDVDFENETITIETIAPSAKEAKHNLQISLAKVVILDTKTVQESDPLEKALAKIKKPKDIVDAKVKAEPILAPVIFSKPPTTESVVKYVNEHVYAKNIRVTPSPKIKHQNIYKVKVQLPPNAMVKRSRIYYNDVKTHAKKQEIPMALVFAIMHSESSFNPRARSYIPAFGLMQIVPSTAGVDTYKYLYKEKRVVSGSYLYNSTNNITMGSAYLHILYYNYLKEIKNPDSRLYCTIAAYNTGAGNIAYAFNRHKNLTKKEMYKMKYAAADINALKPREVYERLLKDLKFDEPKHYLKKVSKRMSAYYKIYGS